MLFNCVVIIAKKQTAYCNPFRPVETRSDLLKPVETRFNPFRSVQTRFQASPPPLLHPPFSPLLPLFPFLFGGGEGEGGGGRGEGGGALPWPPRKGEGGDEVPPPPPLRILTTTTKNYQNSRTKSSNLQNLCNLPLPPKGFSQSTAAQNYINTYGGGLSTKNKIHSFIHCGILK